MSVHNCTVCLAGGWTGCPTGWVDRVSVWCVDKASLLGGKGVS